MNINIKSFENMKKNITKVAYGSATTLEAIICFAKSHTAAEAGFDPAFGARALKCAVMKYVEDPVSEFITSDRILQGRGGKGLPGPRTLRVGLTADKENTLVSLKTEPLGVTVK